jgi:hypothetical protein
MVAALLARLRAESMVSTGQQSREELYKRASTGRHARPGTIN